jgi:hypothetical protein
MVINGTLTNLVLEDDHNPVPSGATTYAIDGKTYFVSGTGSSTLTGTNHKTSELDITKAIDASASDKTEAQLNAETFTYEVTFTVPQGGDVTGINYWIYEANAEGWRYCAEGYRKVLRPFARAGQEASGRDGVKKSGYNCAK